MPTRRFRIFTVAVSAIVYLSFFHTVFASSPCATTHEYVINVASSTVTYRSHEETERPVISADARSFVAISSRCDKNAYAKDRNTVYFQGESIADSDPATFILINPYAKDKNHVFFKGRILQGADAESFRAFTQALDGNYSGYFRDKNNIYFEDEVISPVGFEFLDKVHPYSRYARNRDGVYYGHKIVGADSASFVVLSEPYAAKDKNHVYDQGNILTGIDPDGYQTLECSYSKNHAHVYRYGELLQGFDAGTFTVLTPFCDYTKDRNGIYHENIRMAGVDVATFKLTSEVVREDPAYIAYDKNYKYLGARVVGPMTVKDYPVVLEETKEKEKVVEKSQSEPLVRKSEDIKTDVMTEDLPIEVQPDVESTFMERILDSVILFFSKLFGFSS